MYGAFIEKELFTFNMRRNITENCLIKAILRGCQYCHLINVHVDVKNKMICNMKLLSSLTYL